MGCARTPPRASHQRKTSGLAAEGTVPPSTIPSHCPSMVEHHPHRLREQREHDLCASATRDERRSILDIALGSLSPFHSLFRTHTASHPAPIAWRTDNPCSDLVSLKWSTDFAPIKNHTNVSILLLAKPLIDRRTFRWRDLMRQ